MPAKPPCVPADTAPAVRRYYSKTAAGWSAPPPVPGELLSDLLPWSVPVSTAGKTKLKTAAVNATGFVIDGEGKGAAVCKKPASGPWPVAVR